MLTIGSGCEESGDAAAACPAVQSALCRNMRDGDQADLSQ